MRVPPVEGRRRKLGLRGWLIIAAILIVVLLLSLRGLARAYTDYLWFQDVGFAHAWRSLIAAKVIPALIFSVLFFVLMLVNLIIADRVAPRYRGTGPEDEIIERYRGYVAPYEGRVRVLVSLFFAIVMGSGVAAQWQAWILFSHSKSFHIKDPQFHKDIGFYVFRLPFYQFAAGWVFNALLVVLIVTAVFHYLNGGIRIQSPFQRVTPQVKVHLSVLLALMALTKTVQYYLAQFALTLSHNGFVDGATYTDVHARLPALRLLIVISIAAAALFIVNIWRKGWIFPIIAVGLWGFISIVIGAIYPAVIQRFTVQPNELAREQQYIVRNIAATQDAFNLSPKTINTQQFNYTNTLNPSATKAASDSLANVRLYDPDPAKQAFQVSQAISPFYDFNNVSVDRYKIGDEIDKPTLTALRELDQGHLPDNSWTSQHLVYTHGFGVVAAAADEVDTDHPSYVLQGIPPTGDLPINTATAGVYFGEHFGGYAVVNTKVAEQEATSGGSTKTTTYQGAAGVKVSSFARKAALALRFGDWNLFVSSQLTSSSRVIYIRDIMQRVQTAAPFLHFDSDPYPVVSNGQVFWMLDGYTTSNNYPYSQSINGPDGSGLSNEINYARNSVKVTIDAYNGTMKFYIVDPSDPIIQAYRSAFPSLFTDVSQMPPDLVAHWRYPEDLFNVQTQQYALYHITDPVQFFNKQAIWDVSTTPEAVGTNTATTAAGGGNNGGRSTTLAAGTSPIDPIYLTMQLPGQIGQQTGQEFVLERSFTPRNTNGILSSFVFARSDPGHYGQIVLYNVTNTQAPSPSQAATAILSDQFISQQFTLLGQGGSAVLPGAVQLIPVGNTVVYFRPIWLVGEGSSTFPRFKFVAAALGGRAVLGIDVNDAVTALVNNTETQLQKDVLSGTPIGSITGPGQTPGSSTTTTTLPGGGTTPPPNNASVEQLLAAAAHEFDLANQALARQDLAGYQQHVKAAQQDVQAAQQKAGGSPSASSTTTVPTSTTTKG
jgi:uncharacterized membrane protein (UPF0182 family)